MAMPSPVNPLYYIIQRQYRDNVFIKNKLFSERLGKARNLYRKDLLAHYGCVNAIEFSEDGEYLVSGGDDKRVLLWSVAGAIYDRGSPIVLRTTHGSNIFCLTFDSQNEKIFSGGNDDQVLIHEIYTRNLKMAIPHEKPVYGISIHPQNDNILATSGEDGRILMFDIRENPMQDVQVVAQQNSGFHSVMFNPTNPRFLVTANSEEGIGLWDCRKPKVQLLHYDSQSGKISGISACFDSSGKKVLALRRRLPPVIYATESEQALCQFYHPQYYNSCTMKTCCFAGNNDEYILSGSDDFNLYMWKVPTDECEWGSSHLVLRGHRSIVNQVRYNPHNNLIASSGVEKMVKLWSAVPIGNWKGSILKEYSEATRTIYTHEDYISLVGTTERINHDYSDQSTNEDSKMMAFFDSLIQREIEGWDSQSDDSLVSDSNSEEEMDWTKVISKIFRNGKHNSDEPRKYRSNRIMQLISKKKNRLAKLAHNKSSSYVRRYQARNHKRKSSKSKPPLPKKHNGVHKKLHKKVTAHREPSRHKSNRESRPSKYFTRQRVRDLNEQINNSLDGPSTSTGITGIERSVYRIIDEDSDEEPRANNERCEGTNAIVEEDNFINILPTPLNGTRDVFINVLEVATVNSTGSHRNHGLTSQNGDDDDEDGESTPPSSAGSPRVMAGCSRSNPNDVMCEDEGLSSDSDFVYMHTPKKRCVSVSDSGCATGPSSSASSCSVKNNSVRMHHNHQPCSRNNNDSSEDEYHLEKFRKRIKKARLNIRRKIGADSDSN